MKSQIVTKKFSKCVKHSSDKNIVCTSKQCVLQDRILCSKCFFEEHQLHEGMQFQDFDKGVQMYLKFQQEIIVNYRNELNQRFQQFRLEVMRVIDELQDYYLRSFEIEIYKMIKDEKMFKKILESIRTDDMYNLSNPEVYVLIQWLLSTQVKEKEFEQHLQKGLNEELQREMYMKEKEKHSLYVASHLDQFFLIYKQFLEDNQAQLVQKQEQITFHDSNPKGLPTYLDKEMGGAFGLATINNLEFASAGLQQDITIRSQTNGTITRKLKTDHTEQINFLISLNEKLLVSSSNDHQIKLWDPTTMKIVHTFSDHLEEVFRLAPLTATTFCSCSKDKTIKVFDTVTKQMTWVIPQVEYGGVNYVIAVRQTVIASSGYDAQVRLWGIQDEITQLKVLEGHQGNIYSLCLLNQREIAAGGADQADVESRIIIWNIQTGEITKILEGHENLVSFIISVSKQLCVSGSFDGMIIFWNYKKGTKVHIIQNNAPIYHGILDNNQLYFSIQGGDLKQLEFNVR